jgi:hypothetical protein
VSVALTPLIPPINEMTVMIRPHWDKRQLVVALVVTTVRMVLLAVAAAVVAVRMGRPIRLEERQVRDTMVARG